MPSADRKHLKLRHNTWYFQKRVPKALKGLYPDHDMIEESLGTGDIREAREKRDILLGQLRQRERLLKSQNQPRQRFLQYVEDLRRIAVEEPFIGPDMEWHEILDPETAKKTNDPEYIEAFRTVMQGKTQSERYGVTLNEVLEHFIRASEREGLHTEGTRTRFKKTVQGFLQYLMTDDVQVKDIERSKVFDYIDHCRETQSGSTVQGTISRLKNLWDYAYSRAWVTGHNPFEKHKINTTKGRQKKQPFTGKELKKLFEVLEGEPRSMQLLARMGLYTGARISELVSLRRDHLKDDEGVLLMGIAQQESGKTDAATRWTPVPAKCKALVKELAEEAAKAESEFLFHDLVSIRPDGRYAYAATKRFGEVKREHVTDMHEKGFHSFRVMMATALQQANVSELEAAYLLGHSRKGLTMSYGYYSKGYDPKRLFEAQSRAGKVIDKLFGA
ncbi:tyrosine-type recombinase/integrase [Billgrantia sp. Q4P2]|uniref:tyrosine-type recombinase/integrase n=1 Tax=Billgrantia sp. Q4P2 TaxID=3463857 RepID=UPI004055B643